MKRIIMATALLFSISSFAAVYQGTSRTGKACFLRTDNQTYISLGQCGILLNDPVRRNNKIIYKGSADFLECKMIISLDDSNVPIKAVLKTRHLLKPVFVTEVTCTGLKQIE